MLLMMFLAGIINVRPSVSQWYPHSIWDSYEGHGHHVESQVPKPKDIKMGTKLDLLNLYLKPHKDKRLAHDDPDSDDLCIDQENILGFGNMTKVKKDEKFSVFKTVHKEALLEVKDYLMKADSPEQLVLMAKNIRNCLNEYVFYGSLINVLAAKNFDMDIPNVAELHPSDFIESKYLKTIIEKDIEQYGYRTRNSQTGDWERPKSNGDREMPKAKEDREMPKSKGDQEMHKAKGDREMPKSKGEISDSRNKPHMQLQAVGAQLFIVDKFDASNISKRAIEESEMEYFRPSDDFQKREKKQVRNTVSFETLPNGNFRLSKTADLTGTDFFLENRVAYFREDFGLNSHHYNWHLVNLPGTPRRNDFFIWMHMQMVARYNAERFSVGIPRVVAYGDFRQPIEVGHRPNLGFDNEEFGERPHNAIPMNFQEVSSSIGTFDQLHANIENGLNSGQVDDEDFFLMLERYHDTGHVLISSTVTNGPTSVMIDAPTSGRDTVFYRWHEHIEDIFERYQTMRRQVTGETLTTEELVVPTLQILNAQVISFRAANHNNEIITGCSYHTIEVSNGLDFRGDERAYLHMTHLDHIPFTHHILVDNHAGEERRGVVRIFIAPKKDEYGNIFDLEGQRKFWIEIDKFMYTFSPGRNYIRRQSTGSSITVDCRDTFDDIAERIQTNRHVIGAGHCGCGWPQHLLVPRGNAHGMPFVIFILISDEQFIPATNWRLGRSTYCGIPNVNLPDRRPMGYPFHHPAPGNPPDAYTFAKNVPNAFAGDISIRFTGFQTDESEASIPSCMQPGK